MKSKRNRLLHSDSDSDPMGTVANLFEDQKTSGKRGKKVGVAYQLENGEIIYVPE